MGDLSSEGSTFYESPHIDRIASEEIKFTRSCVTCPVRNPSRASTPTGKYPTKHEITTWIGDRSGTACRSTGHPDNYLTSMYQHDLPADEMTLAETLRDAGYKTFFAGNGTREVKVPGRATTVLKSIKVAGTWAVRTAGISRPGKIQTSNPARRMSRCRFAPNGRPRYELGLTENTIVCFSWDNDGISSRDAYSTNNLPLYGAKGCQ